MIRTFAKNNIGAKQQQIELQKWDKMPSAYSLYINSIPEQAGHVLREKRVFSIFNFISSINITRFFISTSW